MPREVDSNNSCPADRCGLTVQYFDREFWSRGSVTCWRPVYGDSQRCIWHAEVDSKPLHDLRRHWPGERLDGSYLPNVRIDDLPGLSNCCLDHSVLNGLEAEEADLSGASFNSADLVGADFSSANLEGVGLRDAVLNDADLSDANIESAHLRESQVEDALFANTNAVDSSLPETSFQNCEIRQTDFSAAYASEVEFVKCEIEEARFEAGNLEGGSFIDSTLVGTSLTDLKERPPDFIRCKMTNCDFSCSNLSHANFEDVNLIDSVLANIEGLNVHFRRSTAVHCDFSDSYLKNADFPGLEGPNTDFSGSDCSYADFSESDLKEVSFADANLQAANLSVANLESANLERTDLRNARLDRCELGEAILQDVMMNEDTSIGEQGYDSQGREKTIRIYRKFQRVLRENSLNEQIPLYRIKEMDLRRKEAFADRRYYRWFTLLAVGVTSRYGERPLRVLEVSLAVIFALSGLYAISGEITPIQSVEGVFLGMNSLSYVLYTLAALEQGIRSFFGMPLAVAHPTALIDWVNLIGNVTGTLLFTLFVFTLGRVATR